MATSRNAPRDDEAFFVGYLNTPGRLALFYALVIPTVIALGIALGVAFGASQADPGEGRFFPGYKVITGVLRADPYPVIHTLPDADHPEGQVVTLTGPGKVGALRFVKDLDGQLVDAGGVFIARGEHRIMQVGGRVRIRATQKELTAAEQAFAPPEPVSVGRYTLKGEIVDSKCYLGAMRPGQGKIHMACANFCMHGGIAPVFVTYNGSGPDAETFVYLMAGPDGGPIDPALLDYTSLAVALTGEVEKRGDLYVLKVGPGAAETL